MKKIVLTLAILMMANTVEAAFGDQKKPKPAPKPAVVVAPKPIAAPTPAPKPVVAPAPVVKPAPTPVQAVETEKPVVVSKPKIKKVSKPKPVVAPTPVVDPMKQKEDDVIKFVKENKSCSKNHAWSRIKDSGFTEQTAPTRVIIEVNGSINQNGTGCEDWLAKNEPKPTPKPVNKQEEIKRDIKDALGKFGREITENGVKEPTCTQAQKMMNQC